MKSKILKIFIKPKYRYVKTYIQTTRIPNFKAISLFLAVQWPNGLLASNMRWCKLVWENYQYKLKAVFKAALNTLEGSREGLIFV